MHRNRVIFMHEHLPTLHEARNYWCNRLYVIPNLFRNLQYKQMLKRVQHDRQGLVEYPNNSLFSWELLIWDSSPAAQNDIFVRIYHSDLQPVPRSMKILVPYRAVLGELVSVHGGSVSVRGEHVEPWTTLRQAQGERMNGSIFKLIGMDLTCLLISKIYELFYLIRLAPSYFPQ